MVNLKFNLFLVHKARILDPSKDSKLLFILYYRYGDDCIRLKMVKKQKREIEDRQRLIVDRSDGTSFADFDCIYMYNKTNGVEDPIYDRVACSFATNGPYVYKVIYERNIYAGLIFKNRFRYELYEDNYPIKIAMNLKYIAVICKRAESAKPTLLIYRDHNLNGSKYLYGGGYLDQLKGYPAEDLDLLITKDNQVMITVNSKEGILFSIQISDMTIKVNNKKDLDDIENQVFVFNEKSRYKTSVVPLKYVFVHLSNQKLTQTLVGGSLIGWLLLLAFIAGTVLLAWFIRKDIKKSEQKVMDSGIAQQKRDDTLDESAALNMNDTFSPNYN